MSSRKKKAMAMTWRRIQKSKHTEDLRFIGIMAVSLLVIFFFFVAIPLVFALTNQNAIVAAFALIVTVASLFFSLGAWIYATANNRFTAVDVITSEMMSLCRSITALASIENLVLMYESKSPWSYRYLKLNEDYMLAEKANISTLGFLDRASIHRIAGFYTSLKILRDRLRGFAIWSEQNAPHNGGCYNDDELDRFTFNAMYSFFTTLENARIALYKLLDNKRGEKKFSIFMCLVSEMRAIVWLIGFMDKYPSRIYTRDRLIWRFRRECYSDNHFLSGGLQDFLSGGLEDEDYYDFSGYYSALKHFRDYIKLLPEQDEKYKTTILGYLDGHSLPELKLKSMKIVSV